MGKYSKVIDSIPRFRNPDATYQERVEGVKAVILEPPREKEHFGDSVGGQIAQANTAIDNAIAIAIRQCAGTRYASAFAATYAELRAAKNSLKKWESSLNLALEAFTQLMADQMENEGITALKMEGGRGVSVFLEPYAQVKDKEKFRQWCIAQGLENQMALAWQTTNSICKELLLAGEAQPDGVEIFAKTAVRLEGE